jgi:hypothetical protein
VFSLSVSPTYSKKQMLLVLVKSKKTFFFSLSIL